MDITEAKAARHEHVDEHVDEKGAAPDYENPRFLNEEAAHATAAEHSLGLWQALKTYKRAAFWSVRKSRRLLSPPVMHFTDHIMSCTQSSP